MKAAPKPRGVIFSAPLVRAILAAAGESVAAGAVLVEVGDPE